jgi:hypothetical protein
MGTPMIHPTHLMARQGLWITPRLTVVVAASESYIHAVTTVKSRLRFGLCGPSTRCGGRRRRAGMYARLPGIPRPPDWLL